MPLTFLKGVQYIMLHDMPLRHHNRYKCCNIIIFMTITCLPSYVTRAHAVVMATVIAGSLSMAIQSYLGDT